VCRESPSPCCDSPNGTRLTFPHSPLSLSNSRAPSPKRRACEILNFRPTGSAPSPLDFIRQTSVRCARWRCLRWRSRVRLHLLSLRDHNRYLSDGASRINARSLPSLPSRSRATIRIRHSPCAPSRFSFLSWSPLPLFPPTIQRFPAFDARESYNTDGEDGGGGGDDSRYGPLKTRN